MCAKTLADKASCTPGISRVLFCSISLCIVVFLDAPFPLQLMSCRAGSCLDFDLRALKHVWQWSVPPLSNILDVARPRIGTVKLSVPLRSTTDGVVVTVGYDAINRTWIGQQLSSIFAFKLADHRQQICSCALRVARRSLRCCSKASAAFAAQ